jgi:flagellar protein FliT
VAAASAVLACQGQLAVLLERMVALAFEGQFRQLPELDVECSALAVRLGAMDLADPTDAERESIAGLFQRIAASQADLDAVVRPQFLALMERLGGQHRPRDRMRGRKQPIHDPEKCPPGGARRSAGQQPD